MLFVLVVCGVTNSSLVLGPLGCRLDVSRLDTSIPKKELVTQPQEVVSTGTWACTKFWLESVSSTPIGPTVWYLPSFDSCNRTCRI
jgi:hypothetical protein